MRSLKFFIASRPESNIRSGFRCKELSLHSYQQSLNDVPNDQVTHDIQLFLETELRRMAENRTQLYLPAGWPDKDLIDGLTTKAGGLFIFAFTLVKFVDNAHYDPRDRLKDLLSNMDSYKNEGITGIDTLYMNILKKAIPEGDEKVSERLGQVLGFLVTMYQPLSPTTIATLLHLERATDIFTSLEFLHSVISVPNNLDKPINFYHKSFPDFLTDTNRCTDIQFFVDRDKHHFLTSHACMLQLQRCLKKNICSVPRYTLNEDIDHEHIHWCINKTTEYCCRYWVNHLLASTSSDDQFLEIHKPLLEFLKTRQLEWFEAFALVESYHLPHPALSLLGQLQDWLESVSYQVHSYIIVLMSNLMLSVQGTTQG